MNLVKYKLFFLLSFAWIGIFTLMPGIIKVSAATDSSIALDITSQTPKTPINLAESYSNAPPYANDQAWKKPTFASTYYDVGYPVDATDGIPGNMWRTASSTGTWFYVDLGVSTNIQSIITTLYVDEKFASAPRTYFITSNDLKTWQIMVDEVNQKNASGRWKPRTLILPQDVTARYVGLYAADWGGGWADLTQFSVLNTPIPEAGVVWPTVLLFGVGFILVSGGIWFEIRRSLRKSLS